MSRWQMVVTFWVCLGGGCLAMGALRAQPVAEPAHDGLEACYIKLGNPPHPDTDWFDDKANYDYILLAETAWNTSRMAGAVDSLHARNADLRIGSYLNVMAVGRWIVRQVEAGSKPGSWSYEFYRAVTPYLARTNGLDPATGEPDTAAIFKNDYCVNILIPEARAAIIELNTRPEFLGAVDWFFLDFLTVPMPDLKVHQSEIYREMEHGDMDLDQDGIGHWDDEDEQRALHDAFVAFVNELRAALPPRPGGFLLIPNGRLCYTDDELAALVDGVYIEGFPMWHFGTHDVNFAGALDPDRRPSLWTLTRPRYRNGVGAVMIEDRFGEGQLGHVAALFDGCVEAQRRRQGPAVRDVTRSLRWLAAPTGPVQKTGAVMTRPFVQGILQVEVVSPSRIDVTAERGR